MGKTSKERVDSGRSEARKFFDRNEDDLEKLELALSNKAKLLASMARAYNRSLHESPPPIGDVGPNSKRENFDFAAGYVAELSKQVADKYGAAKSEAIASAREVLSHTKDILSHTASPYVGESSYASQSLQRRLSAALSIIGFLGTYMILSPQVSGSAVSSGASTTSYSLTGILLFFLGIMGLWNYKRIK